MKFCVIIYCLLLAQLSALASQDVDLVRVLIGSGLRLESWAANGDVVISQFDDVSQDALRVRRLRVKITFGSASYAYLAFPDPPLIAAQRATSVSVGLREGPNVGQGSVAVALGVSYWPAPRGGVLNVPVRFREGSGAHEEFCDIEYALATKAAEAARIYFGGMTVGPPPMWLNKYGFYVSGRPGSEVEFAIESFVVRGTAPMETVDSERRRAGAIWNNYTDLIGRQVDAMMEDVHRAQFPNDLELAQQAVTIANSVHEAVAKRGFPTGGEWDALGKSVATLRQLSDDGVDGAGIVHYAIDAIDGGPLPTSVTFPLPGNRGGPLMVTAAPGEVESAAFVLRATSNVGPLRAEATDLRASDDALIDSKCVQIRIVKEWFQSNTGDIHSTKGRHLVSELLVHDDSILVNDYDRERSFLRIYDGEGLEKYVDITSTLLPTTARVIDSSVLSSFSVGRKQNKTIWVTITIPDGAAPGTYIGRILLKAGGNIALAVPVEVRVHPFRLRDAASAAEHSLYYRARLYKTGRLGSELKSTEQMSAELANMKSHGIAYLGIYAGLGDIHGLTAQLKMMTDAGFGTDHLYQLGNGIFVVATIGDEIALSSSVRLWREISSAAKFGDVYFYALDEGSEAQVQAQARAWETVHQSGGKVFAASWNPETLLTSRVKVDLAIVSGRFDATLVARLRERGSRVFSYGNPQVGVEDPTVYRRNFGFLLIAAGYDGVMNYAYQACFDERPSLEDRSCWNDFNHARYRGHVFAYPVSDGVVDTVQWEGYREAIDDARYAASLMNAKGWSRDQLVRWLRRAIFVALGDPHAIRSAIALQLSDGSRDDPSR